MAHLLDASKAPGGTSWRKSFNTPTQASENVLAVQTVKGGVGKTSLAVGLGGLLAHSGRQVLIVDFDQQGNCAPSLGVHPDLDDDGEGLLSALADPDGTAPNVLSDEALNVTVDEWLFTRPNLHLIPGGQALAHLGATFVEHSAELDSRGVPRVTYGPESLLRLRAVLAHLNDQYDLIIIDSPPGEAWAQLSTLIASRFVLVPTATDDRSVEAVGSVAQRFSEAHQYNPDLELLGLCLFGVGRAETAVARSTREYAKALLGNQVIVFNTFIRDVPAPADKARTLGLLPHELAWCHTQRRHSYPPTAEGLAADYEALAFEVLNARRMALTRSRTAQI